MRLAIVGTAHLQARDVDNGLELGNRSVDILACVQSSRAKDYIPAFNAPLIRTHTMRLNSPLSAGASFEDRGPHRASPASKATQAPFSA